RQPSEECDGTDLAGLTCDGLGLSGTLRCDDACNLDWSTCGFAAGPAVCGNGALEVGEECDGDRFTPFANDQDGLNVLTCVLNARGTTGRSPCKDCRIDRSVCGLDMGCGDGVAQRYEQCDGTDLHGMTCADLGGSGELRCTPYCYFDASGCDGVVGNG